MSKFPMDMDMPPSLLFVSQVSSTSMSRKVTAGSTFMIFIILHSARVSFSKNLSVN